MGNDEDYNNLYRSRTDYIEAEDGELSWFNAGVRVGVGIGLGICLGVGIGVGLLVRTYQTTSRNFRRRNSCKKHMISYSPIQKANNHASKMSMTANSTLW